MPSAAPTDEWTERELQSWAAITILNAREVEIVRLVAKGWKNREIALRIGQTEHVTKNYMRTIYDKLGMHNRVELALWYVRHIENVGTD